MKLHAFKIQGLLAALAAGPALAITDTWDGNSPNAGIGDSNISTGLNWADDTAPVSDLVNTDLIFGGTTKLAPVFNSAFSTDSITFNNTAGAFGTGGASITLGASGIANLDTQTQTINNNVALGAAASSFLATSGGLSFGGSIALGTNTLTLSGAQGITFSGPVTGTGTLTKSSAGTFNFDATATSSGADFNLNAGVTTLVATGVVQRFTATSSIAVNSTATLALNESTILDGAQLTRATGATLAIAAGETLTIQNGGDVIITGVFSNSAGTVLATGGGSTLLTTGALSINGGSEMEVLSGADVSSGTGAMNIGTSGDGDVNVGGSGSSLNGGALAVGLAGNFGQLTIGGGSTGAFGVINASNTGAAGTAGIIDVKTGASVTGTNLNIATTSALTTGSVFVHDAGTVLSLTGGITVGAGSSGSGLLSVYDGATIHSGSGTIAVNATGQLQIFDGGIFNANANVNVNGLLQFDFDDASAFNLAAGRTLTVQGGGSAIFDGDNPQNFTGVNATVTGAGSVLRTWVSNISFNGGGTIQALAGGHITAEANLNFGNSGPGIHTVTVDGAGSQISGSTGGIWGALGGAANVTFSNGAAGIFSGILHLGSHSVAGSSGTALVQSGADVISGQLLISTTAAAGANGSVTVSGAGSTWTISGANSLGIGAANGSTATLNVNSGAGFSTGTGAATVNATGTITLTGSSTFNANGDLTLNGGQLTRDSTSALNIAPGRTFSIANGGDAILAGPFGPVGAIVTLDGAGSSLQVTESGVSIHSAFQVQNGADLSAADRVSVGTGTAGTMMVTGAGSSVTAGSSSGFNSFWGSGADSAVTFSNGATGSYVGLEVARFGTTTTLAQILSDADVTNSGSLTLGFTTNAATSGTITVNGTGSTWTQTGAGAVNIGAESASTAVLNLQSGGTFTSGTGSFTLHQTGVVNIDGGTLTLNGPLTKNGALNFNAGALNLSQNIAIGTGGLFGESLTLDAARHLSTTAATTIDSFRTLTLDGGTLTTSVLVNNGMLDFRRGTLGITGAGGLNIGTGALGAETTLSPGANLEVTNTATVAGSGNLVVDGGSFSAGALDNYGLIEHLRGTLSIAGAVTNRSGGDFFTARPVTLDGIFTNHTAARLTLKDGTGRLAGAGTLNNAGLLTGDGVIATPFNHNAGGEVRAEFGRSLYFTGATGPNAGRLNLQGGSLYFTQPLTNGAAGQINGHGIISFPASPAPASGAPAAGLNHSGQMNLSSGDSLLFGTIAVNTGGKIIASGGATATFFDVFRHAGAEVKASAGSALVFFGEVRGPGSFTGTGTIYMEGGYSPGASPASVTIAPQMVFTGSNVLTMELGGTAAGTQHDKLTFTSAATAQVTWGGTLAVEFINGYTPAAGHSFDLFDFDAARDAGAFTTLTLPPLPAGLLWDSTQLYTSGVISIVPEGLTFTQWAATALGNPAATPGGDHDNDGYDNGTEFALGLFPPQPGTVLPNGGFFTYAEGERLRVLFTRPLDRTGVTLKVQAGSDLVVWEDLAVSVNSAPFTGPGFVSENRAHPVGEPGLVEVRDILNAATNPRRQMRVRIKIAP